MSQETSGLVLLAGLLFCGVTLVFTPGCQSTGDPPPQITAPADASPGSDASDRRRRMGK